MISLFELKEKYIGPRGDPNREEYEKSVSEAVMLYDIIKTEYTMKTELLRIAVQAESEGACKSQLNKFKQFIEQGDYLQAWQTVLGNIEWLKAKNIELPSDLESLANNVGKTWHDNGNVCIEATYVNGKENGSYKWWYSNGQLYMEATHKDGMRHGLCRIYAHDGKLIDVLYFENDRVVQILK